MCPFKRIVKKKNNQPFHEFSILNIKNLSILIINLNSDADPLTVRGDALPPDKIFFCRGPGQPPLLSVAALQQLPTCLNFLKI